MMKMTHYISKILTSSLLAFCALGTAAQTTSPFVIQPGARLSAHWVYSGAYSEYPVSSHAPAHSVRDLPMASGQALTASLQQQADAVANSPYRVTLTLIDKGQVVYRHHRDGVKDDSFVISYSMAKSLTSLMVGHALCAGHIKNLNDKLGDYVPELADTVYGRSSIRHVLNMASGANASNAGNGEPYEGFSADLRLQKISYLESFLKYKDAKRILFGTLAPGDAFDYKNLDTAALSLLVEKATQRPFNRWYEETLLTSAGLARRTAWTIDKDKRALAHAFFYASPDDWLRLSLYSLDVYKGRAGPCLQEYMQQVMTNGIRVERYSANGLDYRSYGYQFWTGMPGVNSEVFWMLGYGGQYIGVDPKKERVLVAASTKEESSVLALFRSWVNSD